MSCFNERSLEVAQLRSFSSGKKTEHTCRSPLNTISAADATVGALLQPNEAHGDDNGTV